jgi:hypothetical protein
MKTIFPSIGTIALSLFVMILFCIMKTWWVDWKFTQKKWYHKKMVNFSEYLLCYSQKKSINERWESVTFITENIVSRSNTKIKMMLSVCFCHVYSFFSLIYHYIFCAKQMSSLIHYRLINEWRVCFLISPWCVFSYWKQINKDKKHT